MCSFEIHILKSKFGEFNYMKLSLNGFSSLSGPNYWLCVCVRVRVFFLFFTVISKLLICFIKPEKKLFIMWKFFTC